jgi:hypothetical protein
MAGEISKGIGALTPDLAKFAWIKWPLIIIAGLAIIGFALWFFSNLKKGKDKWNVKLRIRQEDTLNKKINLDAHTIMAKRITLSNGMRMLFLKESVLGKRLFPLLNYYTKPGVYDVILTADNRIFIITGIEGIDEERKTLNVGVRYPGIDHDFDQLNTEFAELNKRDTRSDILAMIKVASMAIIAIVILLMLVIGGKYWLESKAINSEIADSQLRLFQTISENQDRNLEISNALNLFLSQYAELNGQGSALNDLNELNKGLTT